MINELEALLTQLDSLGFIDAQAEVDLYCHQMSFRDYARPIIKNRLRFGQIACKWAHSFVRCGQMSLSEEEAAWQWISIGTH